MEVAATSYHLHFYHNHRIFHSSLFSKSTPHIFIPKAYRKSHTQKLHKDRRQKLHKTKHLSFPESLRLHTKNPHAIYKDINFLCRQDRLKEALIILDHLEQRGIPCNPTTFSALLSACVRTKSLQYGKQIHVHIRINGLENNEFLRTKLVNMYTSCGALDEAKKVFDESVCESVYPWNALLRGNVVSGGRRYKDVVETFGEMRALGVEMNEYSYCNVIKSFAGNKALMHGMKVHGMLVKNGMLGSSLLGTGLIDMYFKCGKVRLAYRVFEEIDERDVVTWGAMIAGFAHNRRQWEALEYLRMMVEEGVRVNSVILTIVLPVIGEVRARRLGQEVHAQLLKRKGYMEQQFVLSALIDMYCKCGDMVLGRQVFYGSEKRNVVSWTALMSGYVDTGRLDQALRSVVWMQQEGCRPDVVTVATAIPVCAELRALRQGKEIHAYAVKNCFLPNASLTSSLMIMYSKCGRPEIASRLFQGMERRGLIAWTAMIESFVNNRRPLEALEVFRSMQLSKCSPDAVAAARVLSVCQELKALKLGKEMHGYILKKRFEIVPFVSAEILRMYGCCGLPSYSMLVFEAVPVKGAISWTAIIEAYGCNDMFRDAINLFHKMRTRKSTPNKFTFNVLLSICDRAGFADDACEIFKLMTHKYKLKPSEENYSTIVGLLARSGRTEEAQRYREMSSASL